MYVNTYIYIYVYKYTYVHTQTHTILYDFLKICSKLLTVIIPGKKNEVNW